VSEETKVRRTVRPAVRATNTILDILYGLSAEERGRVLRWIFDEFVSELSSGRMVVEGTLPPHTLKDIANNGD
jgi:hypothetical protein